MDDDLKVILVIVAMLLVIMLAIALPCNWRWRANKRDYYETQQEFARSGYVQKMVTSRQEYEVVWVKDTNSI